jgi:hypothetical protein
MIYSAPEHHSSTGRVSNLAKARPRNNNNNRNNENRITTGITI